MWALEVRSLTRVLVCSSKSLAATLRLSWGTDLMYKALKPSPPTIKSRKNLLFTLHISRPRNGGSVCPSALEFFFEIHSKPDRMLIFLRWSRSSCRSRGGDGSTYHQRRQIRPSSVLGSYSGPQDARASQRAYHWRYRTKVGVRTSSRGCSAPPPLTLADHFVTLKIKISDDGQWDDSF